MMLMLLLMHYSFGILGNQSTSGGNGSGSGRGRGSGSGSGGGCALCLSCATYVFPCQMFSTTPNILSCSHCSKCRFVPPRGLPRPQHRGKCDVTPDVVNKKTKLRIYDYYDYHDYEG